MRAKFVGYSLVYVFFALSAVAGPFGLEMGSKIETLDVEKNESKFTFSSVPKPHPIFKTYSGWQVTSTGLCRVIGISDPFENDSYGQNVREAFDKVKAALSEKYGIARNIESLRSDSIWNEPRDWVMSLKQSERTHAADWENAKSSSEKYSIIQLWVVGTSMDSSLLVLEYRSSDFDECVKEIETGQNDSF